MAATSSSISSFSKQFNQLVEQPEDFLTSNSLSNDLKQCLKCVYDFAQGCSLKSETSLPELVIEEFDEEQIWQELELQNEQLLPKVIKNASQVLVYPSISFPIKFKNFNIPSSEKGVKSKVAIKPTAEEIFSSEEESVNTDSDAIDDQHGEAEVGMSDNDSLEEEEEDDDDSKRRGRIKIKPSVVDDKFFKLSEMEAYLEKEEKESSVKEEEWDFFADEESDEDENQIMFKDFFDAPIDESTTCDAAESESKQSDADEPDENDSIISDVGRADKIIKSDKKVNFRGVPSDSESSDNEQTKKSKSSFEKREDRLRKRIEQLEDDALKEKQWQMKGEVSANVRPINSLLENDVEFDMTQRPAPVITEATTASLEDVIRTRIRDKAFDDVERKIKPVITPAEFKKKLVLDQEKSKLSLAQVYEQEYLKQKEEINTGPEEKKEVELKEHVEIKKMMDSLFYKLDALSDFHFIPKPAIAEAKIVNNTPALSAEEVGPMAVTDSALLAPEEVGGKFKKNLMSNEEKTKTDKKRERRKKKIFQAKRAKMRAGRGIESTPTAADQLKKVFKLKNVSSLEPNSGAQVKNSQDFFNKLQDNVTNEVSPNNLKRKGKSKYVAKRLKL